MTTPLILVFYIFREHVQSTASFRLFCEGVSKDLHKRDANIIAYFLPTDTEERIECINPAQFSEPDAIKVQKMIDDITKNFSIGDIKLNDNE